MARAPFQVIVFPHSADTGSNLQYAVFHRRDLEGVWQAIAGGGEEGEEPIDAARREAHEEAGIPLGTSRRWTALDSSASIPTSVFGNPGQWGPKVYVVPEHSFGVEVREPALTLSSEHVDYAWLSLPEALSRLTYDSNRNALWELHLRLSGIQPSDPEAAVLFSSLMQPRIRR